jgi:hypothetical protein
MEIWRKSVTPDSSKWIEMDKKEEIFARLMISGSNTTHVQIGLNPSRILKVMLYGTVPLLYPPEKKPRETTHNQTSRKGLRILEFLDFG